VEAPAGGDDAGQEGVFDSSISGPVAVHLGAFLIVGGKRLLLSG